MGGGGESDWLKLWFWEQVQTHAKKFYVCKVEYLVDPKIFCYCAEAPKGVF